MAHLAFVNQPDVHKVLLHERPEGVYVFVFRRREDRFPDRDYLQDSVALAKEFCEEEYGMADVAWAEVPDDPEIGPS